MKKATALDIFAGCGGSSLGFRRAGFRIVAAVENDPVAALSYGLNLGLKPLVKDVRSVRGLDLLADAGLAVGELTVLIGCPPCQGFTSHRRGSRTGWEPRNQLLSEYVRLVRELQPEFVVFENVPGLANGPGRWRLKLAERALRKLGYVLDLSVVESADYGVPQFRKRLAVIGSRLVDRISLPTPTRGDPASEAVRTGQRQRWLTVRDAIAYLPHLKSGQSDREDELHAARSHCPLNLRRLAAIPRDGGDRSSLTRDLVLRCHKDHDGHHDVYGRMWWDRPAPTLTSGCTNITRGRFAHPSQNRAITVREALLLQGFPKYVRLAGTADQKASQVGNAVPPPLAASLARRIHAMRRAEVGNEDLLRRVS